MWYDFAPRVIKVNPFASMKLQKQVNKLRYPKEEPKKEVKKTVKASAKKGEPVNALLDPSTAEYFKVFQTCTTCDGSTLHHLLDNVITCRICGHSYKILLVN